MRVSVGLPTHRTDRPDEFLTGAAVAELARVAEEAGFDSVFVTDHPFPGDAWLASGGHHTLDPMVALAFAAAATTRLRLFTNLYILAYRNPFLSARAVGSLDLLSGGRVILGVGAGYLEDEFAALGAAFDERNELTDEAIVTMRSAWAGASVKAHGLHWSAPGNTMRPAPVQRPGPPVWIGGNSKRAIRRAVELGDGWVPMPSRARAAARLHTPGLETLDDLRDRVEYAHALADETGRTTPLDIVFTPLGSDMFRAADPGAEADRIVESAAELAAMGITCVVTGVPGDSRAAFADNLRAYGEAVLPRLGAGA